MKKRIITYRQKIDSLLANADNISPEQWNAILQEHLTQIGFFQHEAGTSDRDSYICDSDNDFNCGGAYDLQSVVVCVDVIVSGVVASNHLYIFFKSLNFS